MLNPSRLLAVTGMLIFSLVTGSAHSASFADPPGRVANLSDTQGAVSYSPAGEDAWLGVVRNRPLVRGDGDNPASAAYVKNKETACHKAGIASFGKHLPASVTQTKRRATSSTD